MESSSESSWLTRISIRDAGRVYFISTREIDWLEACGNYVEIHTRNKTYLHRETMKGIEAKLSPHEFARIHRSVIVNIDRIKELHTISKGQYRVSLDSGAELETNLTLHELQELIESS